MERSRPVLLKRMLACAFACLKLKLCRKHHGIPAQSKIVQHAFIEIGNGFQFALKRYHGQAKKHSYVMVFSTNLSSYRLSCYIVHMLSYAAGYL
jgi:hypothetical protein